MTKGKKRRSSRSLKTRMESNVREHKKIQRGLGKRPKNRKGKNLKDINKLSDVYANMPKM
jgi:hypothetical protein